MQELHREGILSERCPAQNEKREKNVVKIGYTEEPGFLKKIPVYEGKTSSQEKDSYHV